MRVSENFKDYIRNLSCFDYGDTAPTAYGAFCREKKEGLSWDKCYSCERTSGYSYKKEYEHVLKLADDMAKSLEVFEEQGSDKTESLRNYRIYRR